MQQEYSRHGIKFQYPGEWELSEQRDGQQLSITVASPHTSFWTVTLCADRPDPNDILAAVLDAFEQEYDELDVYPAKARVCERAAVARDIDFVCLELLNVARVRAIRAAQFTVLVLYQGTDGEFGEMEPVLERITRSLTLVDAGAIEATDADEPE